MIGMGYTFYGEARHLVEVESGDDDTPSRRSLCGQYVVRLVRNWETHQLVEFADYWRNSGTSIGGDLCSRCEHKEGKRT